MENKNNEKELQVVKRKDLINNPANIQQVIKALDSGIYDIVFEIPGKEYAEDYKDVPRITKEELEDMKNDILKKQSDIKVSNVNHDHFNNRNSESKLVRNFFVATVMVGAMLLVGHSCSNQNETDDQVKENITEPNIEQEINVEKISISYDEFVTMFNNFKNEVEAYGIQIDNASALDIMVVSNLGYLSQEAFNEINVKHYNEEMVTEQLIMSAVSNSSNIFANLSGQDKIITTMFPESTVDNANIIALQTYYNSDFMNNLKSTDALKKGLGNEAAMELLNYVKTDSANVGDVTIQQKNGTTSPGDVMGVIFANTVVSMIEININDYLQNVHGSDITISSTGNVQNVINESHKCGQAVERFNFILDAIQDVENPYNLTEEDKLILTEYLGKYDEILIPVIDGVTNLIAKTVLCDPNGSDTLISALLVNFETYIDNFKNSNIYELEESKSK